MFNIATLAVATTAALHLKSASGELLFADTARKLPIRIHVHGPGSAAYGVVESRQSTRALKRMDDNDGKVVAASPEERAKAVAEDLASITLSFENFEYRPEGAAKDSPSLTGEELYRAVYSDQRLGFIAKQVSKFVGDWGNFSAASTTA